LPFINRLVSKLIMRRLQLWQSLTGLWFGLFLLAHALNTLFALAGDRAYDGFQERARAIYLWPPVELSIALALVAHIAIGVAIARRRPAPARPPWHLRLHRAAGMALVFLAVGHALAGRVPAIVWGTPPRFGGLSYAFTTLPWLYYPYYGLLVCAGMLHFVYGARVALLRLGARGPRLPRALLIAPAATVTLAMLIALGGFGGLLYRIPNPIDNPFARRAAVLYARVLGAR
jgi:succinate dehydrogenase/fumarate reductase cytochrome b subunit